MEARITAGGEDITPRNANRLDGVPVDLDGILPGQIPQYDGTTLVPVDAGGGLVFQDGWNASTNSPDLTALSPPNGYYWIVTVAGATALPGAPGPWTVGDFAVSRGDGTWFQSQQAPGVTAFNGRVGAVLPQSGDYTAAQVGALSLASAQAEAYLVADSAGTDTYTAALTPALTAYALGMQLRLRIQSANTGPATLDVDGLGPIPIVKLTSTPLAAGDLATGFVALLHFDGGSFQLVNDAKEKLRSEQAGQPDGVATLDGNGRLFVSELGQYSHVLRVGFGASYAQYNDIATALADAASGAVFPNAVPAIPAASATNPILVLVSAGVWPINTALTVPSYVELRGEGAKATIIRPTNLLLIDAIDLSPFSVLSNLTVQTPFTAGRNAVFGENCIIKDVEVDFQAATSGGGIEVEGGRVIRCGVYGGVAGHAFASTGATASTFDDCVSENSAYGLQLEGTSTAITKGFVARSSTTSDVDGGVGTTLYSVGPIGANLNAFSGVYVTLNAYSAYKADEAEFTTTSTTLVAAKTVTFANLKIGNTYIVEVSAELTATLVAQNANAEVRLDGVTVLANIIKQPPSSNAYDTRGVRASFQATATSHVVNLYISTSNAASTAKVRRFRATLTRREMS